MKNLTVLSVFAILILVSSISYSQKLLLSWGQQNIENYTKEMYDEAQKLTSAELITKNLNDVYWSEVFLTLNASIHNYSKDVDYLKSLATQLTNKTETKLKGTSRLIIWDRIITGDIIFEGKGLIFDNDLFTVAGRANQILQNCTNKNFGYVTISSTENELENLKVKWLDYLSNKTVEEYKAPDFKNAKISLISSLKAVKALIISLQENQVKEQIIKRCLKNIYQLDELPKDNDSPAKLCNPDTYTFGYLTMLFGDEKFDESKDAKWWLNFWNENSKNLVWNSEKGYYEIKK